MLALSIVMPVRNGADLLAKQLDAIQVAIGARHDVEVVIADNGSTDDTALVASSYDDRLSIRVVDASRSPGINVARNVGVQAAAGQRILLCDADDEVDPGWIDAMTAAFNEGEQLLAGPIDYRRLNDATTRQWRGADRASVYDAVGFLSAGHGANTGFTRAVFDRIEGFDETFRYGGEDTDFFWRAQLAGFELREVQDAVVHYRLRQNLRSVWHQYVGYATSEAQLARKFGPEGLHRRKATAPLADLWWLISRAPFAVDQKRRGSWVRRLANFYGRLRGALRHRVLWW
jgi:glycosyltransferase involved in cell wall biosynthesis